ncbi:putative polyvalent protein kinase domain-containing protein [Chitinophaga tropicalis]|uniref:Uncharacterized protein n=1 Tax=Chitinophaga tropicalis TaxID=2683588 RepID=A0A7K1U9H0_9BACT|nr:hypothetical protein [Chitinophaga tropicalis]MVT10665.1 hypothetical protein [Chitinophaga tropicalis]
MNNNDTRSKLENIIKGTILEGAEDHCTTVRNFLCTSFRTSTTVKRDFENNAIIKEEQAKLLKEYARGSGLWITNPPDSSQFLARGGEAMVYFDAENKSVIKLNDGVYYATWLEFFNSVIIHNLLFPNTAYIFLGFIETDGVLYSVMRQPFVTSDSAVDLADVKKLLSYNGFENRLRRGAPTNNYYNKELGIILEDIHDENVIVNSDTLFFIDTVFYTAFLNS